MSTTAPAVRPALPADAAPLAAILAAYAAEGKLLPRSADELLENIRDFQVHPAADGSPAGCCALRIYSADLGEIRSLAVSPGAGGHGAGSALIAACEADARRLGITRVFALTYIPDFFLRLGYQVVSKETLPQKIWRDCFKCAHFPNCGEIAVVKHL